MPPSTNTLWMPEIQLGLGRWKGVYDGMERQWLRWSEVNGQWLPTPAERATQAEQQAWLERQRAGSAEQQVLLERQQAKEAVRFEQERAVQAEQQALLERERAV